MDTSSVQFVGAPCGRHAQNTFYKAFKYFEDGKYKILTLGEFFYMKITRLSPVCVGEIQMIYSNKQLEDDQVLTSVRAYFLPEHTPDGRKECHGEDELFAFSEKFILKAEDLVCLLEDEVRWMWGQRLYHEDELEGEVTNSEEFDQRVTIRDFGMNLSDVDKEKEIIGYKRSESSTHLTILSYPQYCRYRALIRRLENVTDKWLKNAVICAIGGIISKSKDNRIMFCRDTFYDADLEDLDINCEHLAPNLKGRKRKKRSSMTGENGESDSNEVSSEYSIPTCPKEKTGKRESALRNGFRIEKMRVSKDEQEFLFSLHKFMKKRNTPIGRIPSLGFKQIDLYMFYSHGMKIGGYEQITQKRMWKHLYDILGGNPGSTSAATCTRRHYEKLLLPYERHIKGENANKPIPLKSKKSKIMGRPLGRPLGRPPKDKYKNLMPEKIDSNEVTKVVTEDKFLKRIKRRERFKLKLQEKALKWEEIRIQKAKDRDKIKKVGSNPRTVKNILNNAMANKSKSDVEAPEDLKTEKKEKTEEEIEKISENETELNCVKSEPSDILTSPTKHVANQSKLFKPPNDVQLSSSAKLEDMILSQPNPAISPRGPPHPSQPMFYHNPFVQLGSMHPLGLPIIHQIPLAMQQYLQPTLPPVKPVHRPNILRNSPASSSSGITEQEKLTAHTLFQQPAHSNSHRSNVPSQISGKSPVTQPAHSHHKRSHDSLYSPNYSIPSQSKSLSNRSLLFDFETPKRVKKESVSSINQSAKQKSATEDEQPQDFSMKTLCKKNESQSDNSVLDLRQQTTTPNSKDNCMKSQKTQMTLNLPKHSMANILKTPNFSKRGSSPDNVCNKSHVFNSPNNTSSHSSSKGDLQQATPPSSQSSVISPVHPAFPQHFIRSPIPQPGMFPSPSQLQQLYEAQIRATQVAAFEEMMQRDHNMYPRMPFPMFMHLHMNSSKDKNSYAHAK